METTGALDPRSTHLLREAVLRHRESEQRRRHPARLHVGVPGGRERVLDVAGLDDRTGLDDRIGLDDQAARTDLVAALVEGVRPRRDPSSPDVYAWLTRSGHLSLHDLDVAWSAPVHDACAQVGLRGLFAVVTREGWWDPRTGASARWVRLRRQPGA